MLGLWRKPDVTFVAPPCMCADIEKHVRDAIAVRDEMATWDPPLVAWKKLQQMPVLRLKSEPAKLGSLTTVEAGFAHQLIGTLSTQTRFDVVRSPLPPPPRRSGECSTVIFDGAPSSIGLAPSEYPARVGDILGRANGKYQVVAIPEPSSGRVMVVKMRNA